MQKSKRILSGVLAFAMAASLMTGCGGSSGEASGSSGATGEAAAASEERITVKVFRSKQAHEVA